MTSHLNDIQPQFFFLILFMNIFQKEVPTDQDLVNMLPNKEGTLDLMMILKLVSLKGTKFLGDWEFQYQHDPPALEAERL